MDQGLAASLPPHHHAPFPDALLSQLTEPTTASLHQLEAFVHPLVFAEGRKKYLWETVVPLIVLTVCYITATAVLARRLFQRKLSLFRLYHYAEGRFITPSTFNIFALCQAQTCAMTIVWLVVQYVAIIKQSGSMVGVPDALHCFVWWPLHMTVTCAALGSYLACPVPQDNTDWSLFRRLVYHKSFRRPSIVNGTILASPWVGLALSFPAAILTHRDMQAAYHHLERISSAAAGIEPGAEITSDVVRSLLASASQAWDLAARGKMWARLPWTYWLITQSILTLGVVVNTALLLRPLHRQIRDATISYQQDFMTLTEASADQTGESGQSDTTAIGDVIAKSALPPSDGTSDGQQLDHRSAAGIADEKGISLTHQSTTGSSGFAKTSPITFIPPDADQIGDEEQGTAKRAAAHIDEKENRGSSRSARVHPEKAPGGTQAANNTEDGRLKQLKQTSRNLTLFLGGSLIAAPGFIYVAASTSSCIYPAYLNGPDEAYRVVQATYLVNAWTTTWYALSTFTAIFLKYRDESVGSESVAGQTGRASIEARRSREHYHEVFRKQFVPGTT